MADKAFQSSLLRLVIFCSTGLASFLADPEVGDAGPSTQSRSAPGLVIPRGQSPPEQSYFIKVQEQMRNDLVALFTDAGKRATNLSLALKKSSRAANAVAAASPSSDGNVSLTADLDSASLAAAQTQIDQYMNELVPKIVFIAQKAWSERSIYVEEADEKAEGGTSPLAAAKEEAEEANRKELERIAKEHGGQVMTGAELGLTPTAKRHVKKRPDLGMGMAWTKSLRVHVYDILTSIAGLAEACMDERTRQAMLAGQRARERMAGVSARATTNRPGPTTSEQARQMCLSKTAAVYETCDEAIKSLPLNNVEAIRKAWKARRELFEDSMNEVKEASETFKSSGGAQDGENFVVHQEQCDLIESKIVPLFKVAKLLDSRIYELYIAPSSASSSATLDLDALNHHSASLLSAQDDLVACVLYGSADPLPLQPGFEPGTEDGWEPASSSTEPSPLDEKAPRIAEWFMTCAERLATAVGSVEEGKGDAKVRMTWEELRRLVGLIEREEWQRGLRGVEAAQGGQSDFDSDEDEDGEGNED